MTQLFDDIYRTKSLRLPERDYSQAGAYFITLCTQWRISHFGEVIDGNVQLNDMGKIVQNVWSEIPYHFEPIELDMCVIMPNHIHCIITINEDYRMNDGDIVETSIYGVSSKCAINQNKWHAMNRVSTNIWWFAWNKNPMNNKNSLPYIIRWLKWKTSFLIKKHIPSFTWQANYYEHVIRNEKDLERIRTYIMNNPWKWRNDQYYI